MSIIPQHTYGYNRGHGTVNRRENRFIRVKQTTRRGNMLEGNSALIIGSVGFLLSFALAFVI